MTRSGIGVAPRLLLAALALALGSVPAQAQPPAPPPPERFDIALRYRIYAVRDQHVATYDAMIHYLEKQGFDFHPALENLPETDREDLTKNMLTGTISPGKILKLFADPHVETLLLTRPELRKAPPAPGTRVRVRLELDSRFAPARQLELAEQVRALLEPHGFVEAVGYDNRGYTGKPHTRLVGTLPADLVTPLPATVMDDDPPVPTSPPPLLKDLRDQPSGWLAPQLERADLPLPLRAVSPLRAIEVLGEANAAAFIPPPPRVPAALDKISPDLWALASKKEEASTVVRMEIILSATPAAMDRGWRAALRGAAKSIFIEGRVGPLVTCLARAGEARQLAALAQVSTVRLPRAARVGVDPGIKSAGDNRRALRETGMEWLHKLGFRGKGVRVAIIDVGFTGFKELVKAKRLPASTKYIDLTAERSYELLPDELPDDLEQQGHGTRCALAVALAAPEAELTLIRIDPAAPHMLQAVAAYIQGEPLPSEYLDLRQNQLITEAAGIRRRREKLLEERKKVLEDFEDEAHFERDYGLLGAAGAWLFSTRRWHFLRMEELERDVGAHRERELRFLKLMKDLRGLRGTHLVTSPLTWDEGYPLGGSSPLSRWFDELPSPKFLWFQAAGNTAGQNWAGPWRDQDGNGVMEFAPPGTKLPAGRWTRELNFLGWRPYEGAPSADLPAGARVRVSLQWREPHDPTLFFQTGEPDRYRRPLAELRLVILRQLDPTAKGQPADDFEVVARDEGLPQRLDNQPNSSTYEMAVEFTVPKAGRYALRVERQIPVVWTMLPDVERGTNVLRSFGGLTPTGIRPLGVPTLPAVEKRWELRTRLFVSAAGAVGGKGRPVFADFATALGSVGMPGDAHALVTVGAADFKNRPEPYSAQGPPAFLEHFLCPQMLAYDRLQLATEIPGGVYGTSVAAPFAAGIAATLRSANMSRAEFLRYLRQRPGAVLVAPRRKR